MAELARDYMQLRGAQVDETITRGSLDIATHNIALAVQSRFDNGVATTLDLAQSQAQQATIAATLPAQHATQDQLINTIGLLLAVAPGALAEELNRPASRPATPPRVPVGLPGMLRGSGPTSAKPKRGCMRQPPKKARRSDHSIRMRRSPETSI